MLPQEEMAEATARTQKKRKNLGSKNFLNQENKVLNIKEKIKKKLLKKTKEKKEIQKNVNVNVKIKPKNIDQGGFARGRIHRRDSLSNT